LGVLKPAILETDVHLSQLPQSLPEMRLINTKRPLMPDWLSAMSSDSGGLSVNPSVRESLRIGAARSHPGVAMDKPSQG
jgi:hypothetical protein